jgi:Rps23 Pro-64 3,4-dihydroxylase Tpa1-like proline 4-hydroxylase
MTGLFLRIARREEFLPVEDLANLRSYVLANEDRFKSATVRRDGVERVDAEHRIAATLEDFGALKSIIRARFAAALPGLMAETGLGGSPPANLELQIAAHGDGAFYGRHIDNPVGRSRAAAPGQPDRILSAVYYFHCEPKAFSGGELRLFGLGGQPGDGNDPKFIDIEPVQNRLIVFHSWVPHEVRPVSCPSGRFRDYRFAINCWYRRERSASAGGAPDGGR